MKNSFKILTFLVVFALVAALALAVQPGSESAAFAQTETEAKQLSELATPQRLKQAVAKGEIDQDTANLYLAYALSNDKRLPAEYHGSAPWDGTLPLLHLRRSLKTMRSAEKRQEIESLLAGYCSDSDGVLPSTVNSTHFHIQYGNIYGTLNINSYINSLETTWTTEIDQFGWAAPPVYSTPPPGNRYHVRIDDLGSDLYGYVDSYGVHAGFVGDNPNTPWNDGDAYASCMVLNNDYTGFPSSEQASLDATTAHEFNHSVQFGYGALTGAKLPDDVFIEGGASWMEDEVFDNANDNYFYLWPELNSCMGEYSSSFPYPYWIVLRGLTERFGAGTSGGGEQVMEDFWELTSQGISGNLAAMNTALQNKGTTLAEAYHAFAITAKFNATCGGGYVYPYCFEEGADYVSIGGETPLDGSIGSIGSSVSLSVRDNYALSWVALPTSGPYDITLRNTSSGGALRASVVCDTGSSLMVTSFSNVAGPGGAAYVGNYPYAGCTNVVVVITNQAQTAENPSACSSHNYQLSLSVPSPVTIRLYVPMLKR